MTRHLTVTSDSEKCKKLEFFWLEQKRRNETCIFYFCFANFYVVLQVMFNVHFHPTQELFPIILIDSKKKKAPKGKEHQKRTKNTIMLSSSSSSSTTYDIVETLTKFGFGKADIAKVQNGQVCAFLIFSFRWTMGGSVIVCCVS